MHNSFFTVMGHESADVANEEQVVVCLRSVDDDLTVYEDFIGLKPVARCTADDTVKVLLVSLFLSIKWTTVFNLSFFQIRLIL